MHKLGATHIIEATNKVNTASVIFLHGSGDTGKNLLEWVKYLVNDFALPHVKFLFPTAPLQPYTASNGELSNVWFDRDAITPEVPENSKSLQSIESEVKKLISNEVELGIPLNRIAIGGFSMGGALALHTAYRFTPGLAGAFAMSSFLNNNSAVYQNIKSLNTPLVMYHGNKDTLVPIEWGQETVRKLTELGVNVKFTTLQNTFHELKEAELLELLEWLKQILL